jgi:ABC-type multidrug transport system fused ATPase/permease subunit
LNSLFDLAHSKNMTVVMIAHRLDTAINYSDKVLVIDKGSVAEFDHSFNLLVNDPSDDSVTSQGLFASMVRSLQPEQ